MGWLQKAMGWSQDVLGSLPLASVLKERLALIEQKYDIATKEIGALKEQIAALKEENEKLRAQIVPSLPEVTLAQDTIRVLMHMFKMDRYEDRNAVAMAVALDMEYNVLRYHVDRLVDVGLIKYAGRRSENDYWATTSEGREFVVEQIGLDKIDRCL